jgi:hypothetical protein
MIKKLLFISALVFLFVHGITQQTFNELNANNINCSVTATGDLFNRFQADLVAGFEVPAGSDLRTIYAANLWIGGITTDQQIKLAAETFQADGTDWYPGPLTADGSASTTQEIMDAYNQVWKANRVEVEQHVLYFNALENGGQEAVNELFPNGYTIPEWLFDWPAHGDPKNGLAYYLAPFIDHNENLVYDPENGDYPSFCGDECLFFIFNDKGGMHTESGGEPIGLEIHGMLYGFNSDTDEMLSNTVFLKYKIINRGTLTLTDTYLGVWSDFDIGNSTDDYVGTNVLRSAIYGYNGDDYDQNGYENNIPLQAIAFLNGPNLPADTEDNPLPDNAYSIETNSYGLAGNGFGNGIPDDERFGLSRSLYYSIGTNPINGDPSAPIHYLNYMRGFWKNGQAVMYGGNGISGPGVEDYTARYMFPDSSDPIHMGTEGIEAPLWNEVTANNATGDRRMIGSVGPFTMASGDVNYLDLAFVFTQKENEDDDLFVLADTRLKEAKLFYNEFLEDCEYQAVVLGHPELKQVQISVYPNPAQDELTITTPLTWTKIDISVLDIAGNLVETISISGGAHKIDLSQLSAGTYALRVQYDDQLLTQKIIVQ